MGRKKKNPEITDTTTYEPLKADAAAQVEAANQAAAETEAPAPPPKPETCREWLKYSFTAEEREILANSMSHSIVELATAKEELKTIKDQYKARITALEGEISGGARMLHAGYEMRNIDCVVVKDYEAKTAKIVRQDTGELVRQRKLTPDELQRNIFEAPETPEEVGEALFGEEEEPVDAEFQPSPEGEDFMGEEAQP